MRMKKIIAVVLSLIMILGMTACEPRQQKTTEIASKANEEAITTLFPEYKQA